MNNDASKIFKQVDIKHITNEKNLMLSENDGRIFIVASKKNSAIIIFDDEYISIDSKSIYMTDDLKLLEQDEDLLIISIKGELCEKYINRNTVNSLLKFSADSKIIRIISRVINEKLDLNNIDQKKKFSLAMEVLIDIVFYNPQTNEQTNRVASDALFYIHEHYYEVYGIEQLADELNVSESYLIRMFKKQMDITPLKYLQQFKVEKAKEFLLQQSLDIKTVAGLCGYSNANYFGKVFKKISGITPGEYRESHQIDMHDSLPDEFYL